MIKRGLTHITIILSAILLVICLLLSGCGGKSTFDGSRTSDETGFRMEQGVGGKALSTAPGHPMRRDSGWNTAFWIKKNLPN